MWCAYDSNPGLQDGRRGRIHRAIAATPFEITICRCHFNPLFFPIFLNWPSFSFIFVFSNKHDNSSFFFLFFSFFFYLFRGRARTQSPQDKLCLRVSYIRGNRRGQLILSAMDKPRSGSTAFMIAVKLLSQVSMTILTTNICVKCYVHPVCSAGIQTHDFWNPSLLP